MNMKFLLFFFLFVVLSCSQKGDGNKRVPAELTNNKTGNKTSFSLEQLDSLGRAFVPSKGKYGGKVNLAIASDPDGFSPLTSTTKYTSDVIQYIFEGLIQLDPVTLEFKPNLARSWSCSKNGLVWNFKLRDDVLFSDSVKFSAYDVDFTFNKIIMNSNIRTEYYDFFVVDGKEVKLSVVDSFEVKIVLPKPYAPFLNAIAFPIMPKHKYEKVVDEGKLETYLSNSAKPEDVVGTGPFLLDKIELGQRIILKRNPNYWKIDTFGNRLPYLDELDLHVIKEPNVAMLKFKNGEVDQISVSGEFYPILKPLEQEKNFTLYDVGPTWGRGFFTFNQNNRVNPKTGKPYLDPVKQRWFRNKNFRKACAYAVDYQTIIDVVYNGLASMPTGVMGPQQGFFYNANAPKYSYNPQKAKELLKLEGFIDRDGDGIVEDSLGNKVEFTLTTSSGVKMISDMYEIVRKDLKNIGLDVHINFIEFNNLVNKLNNTYDWDVAALGLGGGYEPHFSKSVEVYSSFRYYINPSQKEPSTQWEKRVAEIFELGVSEMDRTKRKALYNEWQQIVNDQCVRVYMPVRKSIYGVSNKFGNIHLTKYLAYFESVLYNMDEIFIK